MPSNRRTTPKRILLAAALIALALPASCTWPWQRRETPPRMLRAVDAIDTQRWQAGVPIGGIGAGKIEVLTGGAFGNITINNNPLHPIAAPRGCFAAVRTRTGGRGSGRRHET